MKLHEEIQAMESEAVRIRRALHQIPEIGFQLFKTQAFLMEALESCHPDRIEKLAVVLGTEGEGLAEKTIEACDYTIKIPMAHGVDSLNVAAAAAVAFWELGTVK